MKYKTLWILFFFSANSHLYCMEVETDQLENTFLQRIRNQFAQSFSIPSDDVHHFFPFALQISVLDYYTKDVERRYQAERKRYTEITDINLSQDQSKIALGLANGLVGIFDTHLKCIELEQHFIHDVLSCKLYDLNSSKILLLANDWNGVILRDMTNKNTLFTLEQELYSVDLNVHRKKMVTSIDNRAIIWDCKRESSNDFSTSPQKSLELPHKNLVYKTLISRDGNRLVTAALDHKVRVFDIDQGTLLCKIKHTTTELLLFAYITHDSKRLISAGDDGVAATDIGQNRTIVWMPLDSKKRTGKISALCVGAEDRVVALGTQRGWIFVWDLDTGKKLFPKQDRCLIQTKKCRNSTVNYMSFGCNNRLLAVASDNNKASVWDIVTGILLYEVAHSNAVHFAVLDTTDATFITASKDGNIIVTKSNYTKDQSYLRQLMFLWLLIKRISSSVSRTWFFADISKHLQLSNKKLMSIWESLGEQEQKNIWRKCLRIMKEREACPILSAEDNK